MATSLCHSLVQQNIEQQREQRLTTFETDITIADLTFTVQVCDATMMIVANQTGK